jgi:hypothetical protein
MPTAVINSRQSIRVWAVRIRRPLAPGCADSCARQRHQKEPADQHAPKGSCNSTARGWMHEPVELDPAILIARHDHCVVDLDEVSALHCQYLVAHLLGLLLRL